MKTITVYIEYSAGMSHSGWMGTEETITKEVSDEVAATLQDLIDADQPDDYRRRGATVEAVVEAIEEGHTELQPLHDELCEKFYNMGERFWLFEADNDCIDESLEPAFYQDVEDGLYQPVRDSYDEDWTDEELEDEEDDVLVDDEDDSIDFYACRNNYLNWVNSHEDDLWFIADRVGCDISYVRSEDQPFYVITRVN